MTKARDLANIISGGFTADDIPNIDASKITSGSIADARIPASAVSQHATSFDDNKIVNDISTLALRQASDSNRSAYNTNSQFVDVFQDATGIDTTTNALRDSNEYISTSTFDPNTIGSSYTLSSAVLTGAWNDYSSGSGDATGYQDGSGTYNGTQSTSSATTGQYITFDLGSIKTVYFLDVGHHRTYGDPRQTQLQISNNNSSYSNVDFTSSTFSTVSSSGSNSTITSATSGGLINLSGHSDNNDVSIQRIKFGTPVTTRYFKWILTSADFHDANASMGEFNPYNAYSPTNATGNFTGTTIIAPSSVSSMGAIITYQDNAGTNALNTDIVLQLSADGGSNYTTATLTAMPDFSTGIKMAKVNDLAVTAGTQLKYKISFANQSGSKEARIRGVSLQY